MKKILLILFLGMFLISLTSAFLGTYEQGATVSIRGNLNASSVNVTIYFPNSSIAVDNQPMTQLKGEIWNYSFSSTDTLGEYIYDYCDQDGRNCKENKFEITPSGFLLKTSDSITYLILMGGVLFFFLLCLYGGIVLPFGNERNSQGKIVSVQKLKYFKLACLFTSYILFVWLLNLLLALSTNFSILTQHTKFFEVIFSVVNSMSYPIFVLMFVSMLFLAWNDLNLRKLLLRGITPNG